jgi:hypothetical protein
VPLVLNFVLAEAGNAFQNGVTAADPHATGTYIWSGVSWLQSATVYTFTSGATDARGGAWTPLTYLLWAIVVACGRLWRLRLSRRPAAA